MIEVISFSKKYPRSKKNAVENVNLTVKNGEIAGLLGPNGSGKTTLIKAICGFHYATQGCVKISGADAAENPEICMRNIGYVPENPVLPPELYVKDFLKYAGKTHNLFKNELDKALEKVVRDCALDEDGILDKKIKTLSKGQKQRVSFAQALIYDPQNLVLDEPISGLDPAQIIRTRDLIKNLSKNKAILISTHIFQEVYSLCENLYILNDGKIAQSGTENQILQKTGCENLEKAYVKLTSQNSREKNE